MTIPKRSLSLTPQGLQGNINAVPKQYGRLQDSYAETPDASRYRVPPRQDQQLRNIFGPYEKSKKLYIDVFRGESQQWESIEILDLVGLANIQSTIPSTEVSSVDLLINEFKYNRNVMLQDGPPTFTPSATEVTFYGPFTMSNAVWLGVWTGQAWKYINLDSDTKQESDTSIEDWRPVTAYSDQLVVYQAKIWRCIYPHESGSVFDAQYWQDLSGDGVTSHAALSNINDDPNIQHVTSAERDIWNTLDARVSALEAGSGSTQVISLENDAGLNMLSNLDNHSITKARFRIVGAGSNDIVALNDVTKVSAIPASILGLVDVVQDAGAWYLDVGIVNLTYGASYSVTAQPGTVLLNGIVVNSNRLTCSWSTATAPVQPIVGSGSLTGRVGIVPAELVELRFPVTVASGNLNLVLNNPFLFSCSPSNIVVDTPVIDTDNNEIVFTLAGAALDTQYIITVQPGLVSNAGYITNSSPTQCSFATQLSVPVVTQSSTNNSVSVDAGVSNSVSFLITTSTGNGKFDIADASKIVVSGITKTSTSIVNNNLVVAYSGGSDGGSGSLSVLAGAIKNYNTLGDIQLSTDDVVCSWTFLIHPPVVGSPVIAGQQDVVPTLQSIVVPVASNTDIVVDAMNINITPFVDFFASVVNNAGGHSVVLELNDPMLENTQYSAVINPGAVLASGTVPNQASSSWSFRVKAQEPVITQAAVNGQSINAASISYVAYEIAATDVLAIADGSKITMMPNAISGSPVIVGTQLRVPVALVANNSYSLSIGAGAIKNRNTVNSSPVSTSFATATVLTVMQSPINSTRISTATSQITFPLSNVNGVAIVANTSKIVGTNVILGTPTVSGSNLVVPVSGLGYSISGSIQVQAGAVSDAVLSNTNTITCAFTTVGSVPVLGLPVVDGNQTLASNTPYVEFPIAASGSVTLVDASKISATPSGFVSGASIQGVVGAQKLRVNTSLSAGTNYSITVGAGAVSNDTVLNTAGVTTSFKTVNLAPVVGQTALNSTYQESGFTTIIYPVVVNGAVLIVADPSKVVVSGGPTISNLSVSGSNLQVTLAGTTTNQNISISVQAGAVSNGDTANTNTVSSTIYTKGNIPVLTQSVSNAQNSLPLSPAYVEYAITAGGTVVVADANKVTVVPNTLQSVSVVAGKLRVALNMANNTTYTINIAAGLLANAQTLSTGTMTTTFKTIMAAPTVSQSPSNGSVGQSLALGYIEFPISGTGTFSVNDSSKVIATNATVSGVSVVGSSLRVSLSDLTNSKTVSVVVASGAVKNEDVANTNSVTCSFTTVGATPVIAQSSVSGTTIPKTTMYIDFPITGASGVLAVANQSAIYAPSGYANIVASSSISGSNLRVALNAAAVAFNTAYRIQIDANAVSNDGVVSTNSITCDFSTLADVPVVGVSPTAGQQVATSTSSITFPLTAGVVAGTFAVNNAAAITGTNCTVTGATVSGTNLVVSVSGLLTSTTVTVNVGVGAVRNNTVTNTASRSCVFTTRGDVVGITQSPLSGSTSVALTTTSIDYVLTTPRVFGTLSVDNLKVNIVPNIKSASAVVVNDAGTMKLRIPVANLVGTTSYTVSISSGAVLNDGTASTDVVTTTFTTVAGSQTRPVLYDFAFTVPNAAFSVSLYSQSGWSGKVLTDADIYGPAFDGAGAMAELRYYGYQGNIIHPNGVVVPRNGIDSYTTTQNPDGGYTFDSSSGTIGFDNGSSSPKIYHIIKYSA